MSIKKLKRNYHAQTPKKWKMIADLVLVLSASIGATVMALEISDGSKLWINFIITNISVIFKFVTKFISDEQESRPTDSGVSDPAV